MVEPTKRIAVADGKVRLMSEIVHKFADCLADPHKMEMYLTKHREMDPTGQKLGRIIAWMHQYAVECFEEDIYK